MIKKLHIKNYQSHKNSTFEFVPGVNVIVGESDQGKSAIVRSIVFNTDNILYRRSDWCKKKDFTEVEIEFDIGTVKRKRNDYDNLYITNGKEELAGRTVPENTKNVINFSDLNIQKQLEEPFLLTKTPGEIGRVINKIIKIETIDNCLVNIGKLKKDTQKEIGRYKCDIEKFEDELNNFSNTDELERIIKRLDKDNTEYIKNKNKYVNIVNIVNAIKKLENKKSVDIEAANKLCENVENDRFNVEKIKRKYDEVKTLKQKMSSLKKIIKSHDDEIINCKNKMKEITPNDICPLCGSLVGD